jgi:hypothetical protein
MLSHSKVAEQIELQDVNFNKEVVSEALQIEEVLNRAHEIHRAHGGLFGYDLEDWLEAERELVRKDRPDHIPGRRIGARGTASVGSRKELA